MPLKMSLNISKRKLYMNHSSLILVTCFYLIVIGRSYGNNGGKYFQFRLFVPKLFLFVLFLMYKWIPDLLKLKLFKILPCDKNILYFQ